MLHFQSTVVFKLESVSASFLRDLKQNLLKMLRMKSTVRKKLKRGGKGGGGGGLCTVHGY